MYRSLNPQSEQVSSPWGYEDDVWYYHRRLDYFKFFPEEHVDYDENDDRKSYIATIPTQLSAETLYHFALRGGTNDSSSVWSVKMPQPVVQSNCREMKPADEEHVPYMRDNGSDGHLFDRKELEDRLLSVDSFNVTVDREYLVEYKSPIWMQSPEPGSSSLVGIFAQTRYSLDEQSRGETKVYTCRLQCYWKSAVATLTYSVATNDSALETNFSQGWDLTHPEKERSIVVRITEDSPVSTAYFHQLINPIFANSDYSLVTALMFAEAISRVPFTPDMNQTRSPEKPVAYEYTQVLSGYGYGSATTFHTLSMAVLTTYCTVVVVYLAYTLITGSTSTAWNSPIELVALALQSKKPDHLGHTSVGIDSIKTFQESVGIRVNQQDQVELVFAHDRDIEARGLRKIERNKAY